MAAAEAGPTGGALAVHVGGHPLLQVGRELVPLRLRQPPGRHCGVELLRLVGDERGDQAVDRLALVLRDLSERLAALEARAESGLGDAEVGRGGLEVVEAASVVAGTAAPKAEDRERIGLDPRLQLLALRLRELSGLDRCVDAIRKCLLQGGS